MVEVLQESEGTHAQDLFLIEGGVHPDVTSLFLRADDNLRQQLVGTIAIIRDAVTEHEQKMGQRATSGRLRSSLAYKASAAIAKAYPDLHDNYLIMVFREELTAHTGDELRQIEAELRDIASGEITLTDVEQQQLSNLSDAGMHQYLNSFGIEATDLAFPLLDVGTGKHVYFAQDALKAFPGKK